MKKTKKLLLLTFVAANCLWATSCVNTEPDFDANLLVGYWTGNGSRATDTEHWRYDSNGSGVTWDEADDVYESEAQAFTWTLEGDQLTQIHQFESSGAVVPKAYTVTALSATTLEYKDNYSQTFSFRKGK